MSTDQPGPPGSPYDDPYRGHPDEPADGSGATGTSYGPPAPYEGYQPGEPGPHQHGVPPPFSTAAIVGFVLAFVVAPVGVVVSAVGIAKTKGGRLRGRGLAIAGVVVGAVATVLAVVIAVVFVSLFASAARSGALDGLDPATAAPTPLGTASAAPSGSPSASASASGSGGAGGGAGGALTEAQVGRALLVASDLPASWEQDATASPSSSPDPTDDTDPGECAVLLQALDTDPAPVAYRTGDYADATSGIGLTETVASFEDDPGARLDAVRSTLTGCATFTDSGSTDDDTLQASSLQVPAAGDRSLGVRLTGVYQETPVTIDLVYVVVGSNAVQLAFYGADEVSTADRDALVTAAVDRVQQAAGA